MPRARLFELYWHHRPFWLQVVLAVALLMSVSASLHAAGLTTGHSPDARTVELLRGIERDIAAVRTQLELVGADDSAPGDGWRLREQLAVTPGLGDGSRAFHLRSMETMVRSLDRRVDGLIALQHRIGDDRGLDIARLMSLDTRSVQWGIEELRFARAPHFVRAAQERIDRALGEIARGARAVSVLQAEAAARPAMVGAG